MSEHDPRDVAQSKTIADGKDEAPTPSSQDPVDIAMERVADDPDAQGSARQLLLRQRKLVDEEIRRLGRMRWRDVIVTAFGAILLGLTVLFVANAADSDAVVVESFSVPPTLAEAGIDGVVIASLVQDEIEVIQASNVEAATERSIDNSWTDSVSVEVPTVGISINDFEKYLRRELSDETYVSGSVTETGDSGIALTVRAAGVRGKTFTGSREDLPRLSREAAEYVYGRFEPRLMARYLIAEQRTEEALAFAEDAFRWAPEEQKSVIADRWALALSRTGDAEGALDKSLLAIELDPENWIARNNHPQMLYRARGFAEAIPAYFELHEDLTTHPDPPDRPEQYLLGYYRVTKDIAGMERSVTGDLEASGGRAIAFDYAPYGFLADLAAQRHDIDRAKALLLRAEPDTLDYEIAAANIAIFEAEDRGLVEELAALKAALAHFEDKQLSPVDELYGCETLTEFGALGAVATFEDRLASVYDAKDPRCLVTRGFIAIAEGRHEASDRHFTQAAEMAPILPATYDYWGQALVQRGDLDAARQKYELAHKWGPRWADPLHELGNIAMEQERWKDARERFREAQERAPAWKANNRALKAAQAKVDALPWYKRWF